ncbi:hypothetical protein LguiA_033912 [Lonicera macranthoides]
MVRTIVPHQNHLLIPQEDHTQSPELSSLRLREQECISLLKRGKNIEEFKQAHCQILKLGLFCSPFCSTNLVATCALSNWGSMDYACSIFQQIDEPGSFEFNTMMRGYVKDLNLEEALHLYDEMLKRGVEPDNFTYPILLKACARLRSFQEGVQIHGHAFKLGLEADVFVQNSLINLYGKCGEIGASCVVFKQMDQRTISSWSALISAHAKMGMWGECLSLFGEMNNEGHFRPEESVLVSAISACTHLGALDLGRCTHGSLLRNMSGLNVIVETSLIDMYVKCGYLEKGLTIFQRMKEKNRWSYTVMISGLALHGCGLEALQVFTDMIEHGLEPDDVVYVGVLTACSRAGLVKEGLEFFERMKVEHKIEPTIQHYGCLVDLMSRSGMLDEALELIGNMPIEPNDIIWRSLLSACRFHRNVQLGEKAARNLLMQNPQNASDYLVLSNMYAQAQRWDDAAMARTEMVQRGLVQTPGLSFIEVKKKIYKFVSQEISSPKCDGVYDMIHQMGWQLKFEGYLPDISEVLLDVDEEEKRKRLSGHSQKLAIAFGLIHTSQGSPLRIVRNVRMCSDCHAYTKLVSMIYQRRIIVRDRNQFHHFKDGSCSFRKR